MSPAPLLLWTLGCTRGADPRIGPPAIQGLVVAHRSADGEAALDGRTMLGGDRPAEPDASGFVYYDDLPPGRMPVSWQLDGHAIAYAAPQVLPGASSAAAFAPHPLAAVDAVAGEAVAVEGDGFRLEVPAGTV